MRECKVLEWIQSTGVIPPDGEPIACATCPGKKYKERASCNVLKIAVTEESKKSPWTPNDGQIAG